MSGPPPTDGQPKVGQVVEKPDPKQIQHFVTTIKSAEAQVGANILSALQHDDTVGVLTVVVMGPDGRQQVVSAALNPDMMDQVRATLAKAAEEREEEEPCIGFHCFVKPKSKQKESTAEKQS